MLDCVSSKGTASRGLLQLNQLQKAEDVIEEVRATNLTDEQRQELAPTIERLRELVDQLDLS